eukprot:gene23685-28705_t
MEDWALESNGATVISATASDDRFPADNIIDGKESTFWSTTGMYPHEFIVQMAESTKISKVKIWASHELQDKHNRLQTEVHQVNTKAKFLKFVIHSGWDDFCTVNRVSIT